MKLKCQVTPEKEYVMAALWTYKCIKRSVHQYRVQGEFHPFLRKGQVGVYSQSPLSKCLFYECFPFVAGKYSFTPCQDLRSQKHEEVINTSMEGSLWNPEFGIIFASQAQKPPRQACLLIAFNFPLKQGLFPKKRLIEQGSICRAIYIQVLPPVHSETRRTQVPTLETFGFSSPRKGAAGHESLQLQWIRLCPRNLHTYKKWGGWDLCRKNLPEKYRWSLGGQAEERRVRRTVK